MRRLNFIDAMLGIYRLETRNNIVSALDVVVDRDLIIVSPYVDNINDIIVMTAQSSYQILNIPPIINEILLHDDWLYELTILSVLKMVMGNKQNWKLVSETLGQLESLINSGLIIFDPIYMTVRLSSFIKQVRDQKYGLLYNVKHILDKTRFTTIFTSSYIMQTLHQMIRPDSQITVKYIIDTITEHAYVVKVQDKIINIIKAEVISGHLIVDHHPINTSSTISLSIDEQVTSADLSVLSPLWLLRPTRDKIMSLVDIISNNFIVDGKIFSWDHVQNMLMAIQHVFQLGLVKYTLSLLPKQGCITLTPTGKQFIEHQPTRSHNRSGRCDRDLPVYSETQYLAQSSSLQQQSSSSSPPYFDFDGY